MVKQNLGQVPGVFDLLSHVVWNLGEGCVSGNEDCQVACPESVFQVDVFQSRQELRGEFKAGGGIDDVTGCIERTEKMIN